MKNPSRSRSILPSLTGALVLCGIAVPAQALELLGFYVGAGLGQSRIEIDEPDLMVESFRENHSAWKVVAGIRPISLLGAELQYIDFGDPEGTVQGVPVGADLKGYGAYGLVFAPIPLPFLDVYGKVGYTRLDGSVRATIPGVPNQVAGPLPVIEVERDVEENVFTAGAGVQFKFTSWAVRGEYERFSAPGDDPSLWTISLTKTFF